MNPEIKTEWVRRLRSGNYIQGHCKLCRSYGPDGVILHCCLGVLCEVAVDAGVLVREDSAFKSKIKVYRGAYNRDDISIGLLPNIVTEWAELSQPTPIVCGYRLTTWNDERGADFNQIARMIEKDL